MTKQHFINLADLIRAHNSIALNGVLKSVSCFTADQIDTLADFCYEQNNAFNRERWLSYIAGTCGKNGGSIKK